MWEQYKLIILVTLFFVVVQTFLIIVLVVQLLRQKIAELALIKLANPGGACGFCPAA